METILVVEDEDLVRKMVKTVLQTQGYTVLEATGAREATFMRETHPGAIDLLLTDIVLSGRSGREIAKEFLEHLPGIRIIYMSGYTGDFAFQAELEKANSVFMDKPFSSDRLLKNVRQILAGVAAGADSRNPSRD
jgi:two-component system, cell cycle sensor histidine kinase and response regulator CckA